MKPAHQLTHPLFVAALVALAVNDHVLKGAGVLPGAVTGKLSDLAGLLVAPLALAWLCRVRTRRGWILAHVAVGVGFAALQLPAVAARLAPPFAITPDLTDLLALPMLGVSFVVFARARPPLHLAARTAFGVAAVITCAATGGPQQPTSRYPYPPGGELDSDVMIRHVGSESIEVGVRRLRDEQEVDCDALLDDPVAALEGVDFGDERRWELARGDGVPLWDRRGGAVDRDCYAVLLHDPHGREWYVTWRQGAPAMRSWDIRLDANVPAEHDAMVMPAEADDPPRAPEGVMVRRKP